MHGCPGNGWSFSLQSPGAISCRLLLSWCSRENGAGLVCVSVLRPTAFGLGHVTNSALRFSAMLPLELRDLEDICQLDLSKDQIFVRVNRVRCVSGIYKARTMTALQKRGAIGHGQPGLSCRTTCESNLPGAAQPPRMASLIDSFELDKSTSQVAI